MKKTSLPLIIFAAALFLSMTALLCNSLKASAQNPNPQPNFSTQLPSANPSLYLNFNDLTTSFRDQISGDTFVGTVSLPSTSFPVSVVPYTGSLPSGISYLGAYASGFSVGFLSTVTVCYYTAPASGQPLSILIGAGHTVSAILPVTGLALVSGCQILTSGVNYTGINITSGQQIGFYAASGIGLAHAATSGTNILVDCPGAPTVGGGLGCAYVQTPIAITGTITSTFTSGTVTPRQPGFDSTQVNNTSAEFAWNAFNVAPNNTLGVIEWNVPWSMLVHVDRLNWNRTGTLTFASKGGWALTLGMSGNYSQLCFTRGSANGPPTYVQNGVCTSATFDAMPNGFNYDIVMTDSGTGSGGGVVPPALTMYINGLTTPYIPEVGTSGSFSTGFGAVNLSVAGGTGYANTTAFTSTGGGTNCNVTGLMTSVSGVPTSINVPGGSYDFGCSSVPTIVLTSPTGTGATILAPLNGALMNSTTAPLMVPGYLSAGTYYGVAGTTSTQNPTYVDEFAIFPGVLNQTQIQSLFYQTKFYQSLVNTAPANRVAFVFDDDTCWDMDNAYALQAAISAQRYGFLKIEGVISEMSYGSFDLGASIYRQMLDQAGLAHIPVGVTGSGGPIYAGWCGPANVTTYNASTPQVSTGYPSASTVYRKVMAANPTSPVMILSAGPALGLAQFMQSPADSISPLTGLQLLAQDATNGGAIYLQGSGCWPSAWPNTLPCSSPGNDNYLGDPVNGAYVLANHGAMPMLWIGGSPSNSGPGPLYTRTSKDPMFLASTAYGSDIRAGWDSLPMAALVSSYFYGGVQVGYSGGTGYANTTYFTSTGGGANCVVQGILTASSGVPNGIETLWGAVVTSANSWGIGSGCTSAPTMVLTAPTGTGATLTAYPTSVCAQYRISGSTGTVSSATCDNQWFDEMTQWATPSGTGYTAPIFTWFLNSLIDPLPGGAPRAQ